MRVGRNDPCPCGSGKKHKNCCRARASAERSSPRADGPAAAVSWLRQHHRIATEQAVDDFYAAAGLDAEGLDRLRELPAGLREMVTINSIEWLLAEGEIDARGERRRVSDLVLGPGGPSLAPEARMFLMGLACQPLRLYEVQEAVPGEGVWIRDVLSAKTPPFWVAERTASQSLVRWELIGARLLSVEEGWQFSGALYPIPRDRLRDLKEDLLAAARAGEPSSGPIALCWLQEVTAPPPPLPQMVDAGTGDSILLVTDHYQVTDWEELEVRLARQPEVQGDRENGWVWLEKAEGAPFHRSRLSLNPGPGNRLEVFAQTLRRAEEGAAWLREVADGTLVYRTREITDPAALMRQGPPAEAGSGPAPIPLPQEVYQEHYRHWPDEPIPALGHRTPRQAARTRAGREQVIELLKDYEMHDRRQARAEGREPISWDFLWEEMKIKRPR